MDARILLDLLRKKPFQPFRVTLSTGQSYVVGHPEQALLDCSTLYLGVPGPKGLEEPFEEAVWLSLLHLVKAEPVDGRRPRKRSA